MKAGMPIIASTGMVEKARPSELKGIGVERVLYKPYGADTLLHAIHQALHPTAAAAARGAR
jgi:CheY-like chemotaxis protein